MINALIEFSKTQDLSEIGLALHDKLQRNWYDCTPANCLTFASTGGDGVHFSLIEGVGDSSPVVMPVVMTVPMNFGQENLVIAESLYEFLCLGCRFGYFGLEQLAYDFDETAQEIEDANTQYSDELDEDEISLLQTLSSAFELKPIPNVARYLINVQQKHSAKLALQS